MWVEREAGKAAGQRGGVSSDVVRAEATEFALQLAVHLTSKSQVMLFDAKHSQLFAEGSSADVFFGKDDLTRSARVGVCLGPPYRTTQFTKSTTHFIHGVENTAYQFAQFCPEHNPGSLCRPVP